MSPISYISLRKQSSKLVSRERNKTGPFVPVVNYWRSQICQPKLMVLKALVIS
jgi:hypothetical protein